MIYLISNNGKTFGAYATLPYSNENQTIVKKNEKELTDMLSDILEEGETWRNKYKYLSLDKNGEIYLDTERYENEKED